MRLSVYLLTFALVIVSLSFASAVLTVPYDNENVPRVIINSTSTMCCGNCTNINNTYINQTIIGGNSIWINDSTNQIKVNNSYTGPVNISDRDFYLPGSGYQVVRMIDEGDYGIDIQGEVADGIRIAGATDLNGVFNGYGIDVRTILVPATTDRSFWGYLANIQLAGGVNASEMTGYIANPRVTGIPYTATLDNLTGFESQMTWASGIANTVRGVHIAQPTKTGGTFKTQIGIDVEDINLGNSNFAIRTGSGRVLFRDNVTAPNLCYSDGTNCTAQAVNLSDDSTYTGVLPEIHGGTGVEDSTTYMTNTINALPDNINAFSVDTLFPAYDPILGAGYAERYDGEDILSALITELGNRAFGQPARRININTISANLITTEFHGTILVNTTSGSKVVTLDTAIATGREYAIKKIDASANNVTINTTSATRLIDGTTIRTLTSKYQTIVVQHIGGGSYTVISAS